MKAMASTNSVVPTIHNRKSSRRQFTAGHDAGLAFGPAPFLDSKIFQPPSLFLSFSRSHLGCAPGPPTYYQIYP
jgi:hypothetical protein